MALTDTLYSLTSSTFYGAMEAHGCALSTDVLYPLISYCVFSLYLPCIESNLRNILLRYIQFNSSFTAISFAPGAHVPKCYPKDIAYGSFRNHSTILGHFNWRSRDVAPPADPSNYRTPSLAGNHIATLAFWQKSES